MNNFSKEYILKENFSNKKNLLVLIGHLRTIEYLIKYHKKFLQKTNSDLIISTWTDDETEAETFDLIKKELKPVYFEIEEFNFNLTADIFGNLNKFDLMFGKAALSSRAQIYKFLRSVELIKKVENLQNKRYEIIFKSRPDLFLYSNVSMKIPEETILFENSIGDWNRDRSDRFFYGKRNIFFSFMKIIEQYSKKAWSENSMYPVLHQIPLQEQLIKYCVDKGNINSKPFLPIIKVWRPNIKPNIVSVGKIFLYMFLRTFRIFFYRNEKNY